MHTTCILLHTHRPIGYETVHLPLCKADTPFHTQGDDMLSSRLSCLLYRCLPHTFPGDAAVGRVPTDADGAGLWTIRQSWTYRHIR